ncbi:elastase-1-like, partial [Acridotheres tristis]
GSSLGDALQKDVLAGRVTGGHEAQPNSCKWQVSLQISYPKAPGYYTHICGGTLIRWVMTAAHCLSVPPGASYWVVLGEHTLLEVDGTEYYLGVDAIFIHDGWNPNDIATFMFSPTPSEAGFGDSGSPLSCYRDDHWEVHGIVSFGLVPYCNSHQKPRAFTGVSAYVDWIYRTVENNGGF